jgi:hypothetical protein
MSPDQNRFDGPTESQVDSFDTPAAEEAKNARMATGRGAMRSGCRGLFPSVPREATLAS